MPDLEVQLESEDEEEAFDAERKLEALARKTDTWLAILQVRVRESARERAREGGRRKGTRGKPKPGPPSCRSSD
jgi:hypothetical protein